MFIWSLIERITRKQVRLDPQIAMISFTFDDAPASSFTKGGNILEDNGYRGTYYVSAGLSERSTEVGKIADLNTINVFQRYGHEIANHTYSHIDCKDSGPIRMFKSIRKNKRALNGIMSNNFSYPYGSIDNAAFFVARLCATSARGISFGINRGIVNPMHLKAERIYNRCGIDASLSLISQCATMGGWLIFYTHDVCDTPSDYGCTPEQLTHVVRTVNEKKLTVATVGKALEIVFNKKSL